MSRLAIDLLAAAIAAAMPVAAAQAAPGAPAPGAFIAPSGPLQLTRVLRRPLPDGTEIVSTRRYAITITPDGTGYRVDGRLLEARVDAPAALSALAAIERGRPDSGQFPFALDARGLIASGARPEDAGASRLAGAAAQVAVTSSSLADSDRSQAEALINQLLSRRTAPGAQWPSDLFHPAPGLHSQTSRFALPDGQSGSVTTTVDARQREGEATIERTVITETGGNQRVTRETYSVTRRQG
jgi:hypothetical protein